MAATIEATDRERDSEVRGSEPRKRLFTRAEYYQLGELGLFDEQRVQLIEGEIVEMSPQKSRHAASIEIVRRALERSWGEGVHVRSQLPIAIGDRSEPEPDVAVIPGKVEDYLHRHPREAHLVVEVSDSSLAFDLGRKQSLYALAGIPEYWVLNLAEDVLEVFRDPRPDPAMPFGVGYTSRQRLGKAERVQPLRAPAGAAIQVGDLLLS